MRLILSIFSLFILLPSLSWAEPTIALIPFENLSGIRAAPAFVVPAVAGELIQKGYRLVQRQLLEEFLKEERIRFLDSIPTPVAQKLAAKFGVDGIVTGTILAFVKGDNPQIALSARLISKEGALLWGQTIGMTGEDRMGMLGLGKIEKIEELTLIATRTLFETFQLKGGVHLKRWGGAKQFLLSRPRTYSTTLLDPGHPQRVGVLPIENQSTNRDAGRILLNLLILRLAGNDRFKVTETADVREAMIHEGIRSFDEMDLEQLKILAKRLDTRLFIGGTIYKYSEGLGAAGLTSPQVELYVSMLDAETGKIVWTSHHSRKGEEYLTVLQFGLIRNSVSLADQVLEEMIGSIKEKPKERLPGEELIPPRPPGPSF